MNLHRFAATDAKGAVAPSANIIINLCSCSGPGECLFNKLASGQKASAMFRTVACNCTVGWTGEHCDMDFDGCGDGPCTAGTNCTDLTPEEEAAKGAAFTCSQCPQGYEDNDGVCVDVNECHKGNHNCSQRCINKEPGFVNVQPGFVCDCILGYRLASDGKNCTDVDECKEQSADCQQICANLPGQYMCTCLPGYELNSDNKTCTDTVNLCERAQLNCTYGCQNDSSGGVGCFCPIGFIPTANNTDCQAAASITIVCSRIDDDDRKVEVRL
ncbi:hypothetical protein LSAT2_016254 [Lamellibrachia satsuma]|nr:hypothetical protein LSAT2_016254 [Lamellibrachia satsuma]